MISVIIPTLNEEETISDCLRSLSAQSIARERYEIIVVDGNSSDNTHSIAATLADRVISQKRAGIGGARGDGAAAANGTILVFTDADTIHPHTWLETMQKELTSGGYDVCTGPVRFYNRTFRSDIIQIWRRHYLVFHLFGFYWLIGSNVAVKKEVYVRAGGHREISILEDYDLSRRLAAVDARCIYDRNTAVFTSARRIKGIFGYGMSYLSGFYHYYITGSENSLLSYPHSREIIPQRFAMQNDLRKLRQKILAAWSKIIPG